MRDKKTIGVVGAGVMGTGIAQVAAQAGHPVVIVDTDAAARERSRGSLEAVLTRLVEKGRLAAGGDDEILRHIAYTGSLNDLGDCALVVEAVVERADVKEDVFGQLARVAPEAVLATNTSSLSVTAIAASCDDPGRVVGAHFFNPVPLMSLVEVVPAMQTRGEVADAVCGLLESWGKITVRAKDTPGFIVNRVARPFYGEALRLFDEGVADVATIDEAMRTVGGFRMGPFELMDLIGNDVNYAVTESVFMAFYGDARYRPSFTQKRMVEAGRFGRKSGRGFYEYKEGTRRPAPSGDMALHRQICDRVVTMLINEAADAVFWRVASPADVDVAMTKGVHYPKGLLAWCDELGAGTVLDRMRKLSARYGEDRYRASVLLTGMAEDGGRFFG